MSNNLNNKEINRLINLGWQLPILNTASKDFNNNLKVNRVHFPISAYETDKINKDLEQFWAEFRAKKIYEVLKRYEINIIWEIGSGDGSAAIPLHKMGIEVVCSEPIKAGADYTTKFGLLTFNSTFEDLNLPNNSIEAIGLFDVLEHIKDDSQFILQLNKAISKNGILLITVPAYSWLFSDFDISIGHFRRYTKKSLTSLLVKNGFQVTYQQYFFAFLILPSLFLRRIPYLLGRRQKYEIIHKKMNRYLFISQIFKPLIRILLKAEEIIRPNFGLSVIICAKKI